MLIREHKESKIIFPGSKKVLKVSNFIHPEKKNRQLNPKISATRITFFDKNRKSRNRV